MSDRNDRGQFMPGNRGGPGRPPRQTEMDYINRLSELVSMQRWETVVLRALADAEQGDPAARKWLGDYLLPAPRSNALHKEAIKDDPEATLFDLFASAFDG